MNAEDDLFIQRSMEASHNLNESLTLMGNALKAARAPIDNDEWDFVTIRGELMDMEEYLFDARLMNGKMHDSLVDLLALVRRLQASYRQLYEVYQTAFHQGETRMLQCFLGSLDDQTRDLLFMMARSLEGLNDTERDALREQINALLA